MPEVRAELDIERLLCVKSGGTGLPLMQPRQLELPTCGDRGQPI